MRIVVDTNLVFSAILNTNSRIAQILLQPRSRLNFYATENLLEEIAEHNDKLKKLSTYSDLELQRVIQIISGKIRFINVSLIPTKLYEKALSMTAEIDIDDTEFVALAEHIKGKLWSGDKKLVKGLKIKGWNKFISTEELLQYLSLRK